MKQILIAIDQLVNALFLGYADESISARAYRLRGRGWYWQYRAINALFFWQENHCEQAYQSELKRRQLPVEYR